MSDGGAHAARMQRELQALRKAGEAAEEEEQAGGGGATDEEGGEEEDGGDDDDGAFLLEQHFGTERAIRYEESDDEDED